MSALDAVFTYKQPARGQVTPTLFIGLGGAGSDMVDRILQKLETRWDKEKYRGLYHGFALDTDTAALDKLAHIPKRHRILLSDFSKQDYVNSKRGERYVPADEHVAQWAHDWYKFRTEAGAGAGQIRLESRLCLHYQLENQQSGIITAIRNALNQAMQHENPYRRRELRAVNVFIYASVAGGTGSGALLPMTYLVKQLAHESNLTAKTYGYVILPGAFATVIPGAQRQDIDANGYAALMEIEHLMRLGLSGEGNPNAVPFRFSGFHRAETMVSEPPFNFVYLLDEPENFSTRDISELRDAVADSMFLQFFSPTASSQASNWDNMVKRVMGGTGLDFVLNYGTFGASALIVPDKDILDYCARRYAIDALDRFVLQRTKATDAVAERTERRTTVDTASEAFDSLSPEDQGKALDAAFVNFVDDMAADEAKRKIRGSFTSTQAARSTTSNEALPEVLTRFINDACDAANGAIKLTRLQPGNIGTTSHDVTGRIEGLRSEISASRQAIHAALREPLRRIKDGTALRELFVDHQVRPLGQRYFLIKHLAQVSEQVQALKSSVRDESEGLNLDNESIQASATQMHESLQKTAPLTIWERIRKENKDFNEARGAFVTWFNSTLCGPWQALLRSEAQQLLLNALLQRITILLQLFRQLSGRTATERDRLEHETKHILRMGGLSSTSSVANLYALDIEVLRDETTGTRLWDRYYDHTFGKNPALFNADALIGAIDQAFTQVADGGQLREPTADEITERLITSFIAQGEAQLGPRIMGEPLTDSRDRAGLLIDDALKLEAQFVRGANTGGAVDPAEVQAYIAAKLRHAMMKASRLSTVKRPAYNPEVHEDRFAMACAHPIYQGDHGLVADIQQATEVKGVNTAWDDHKLILFYQATLGIPVYWFNGVRDRMKLAYEAVRKQSVATHKYPLHIDKHWEGTLGDLDPETRVNEDLKRNKDEDHVSFAFCVAAKILERGADGGWQFKLEGLDDKAGANFTEAFQWFRDRSERVRDRIDGELAATRAHLESFDEPPESWTELIDYLKLLADRQLNLADNHPEVVHWQVLSRYVQTHAPSEVVTEHAKLLAR